MMYSRRLNSLRWRHDGEGVVSPKVFVISHDRYFLDRVINLIVELDEGTLTESLGGYSDYQAAKGI